jgi:hypothetical protein
MPASAHVEIGADLGLHNHHIASDGDDVSDRNGDTPIETGTDVLHHHHCPMGLDPAPVCELATIALSRSLIVPANAAALHSRATAPPLQPPLA